MTVIYLDAYLVISLAVNFCLLMSAGALDGDRTSWKRCLAAAALGAVLGAVSLLPRGGILAHPVGQAAVGTLMLLAAYRGSDRLIRTGALFLLLSCAWGGGLMLLFRAGGRGNAGGFGGPGMRGILTAAALCYGGLSLLLRGQFAHSRGGGELRRMTLTHQGRSLTLTALRDTGNTLKDPLSGRPVLVVEGRRLRDLLPGLPLERGELSQPVELLERIRRERPGLKLQLLPYRAVGVDCGLLLALRLEKLTWRNGSMPDVLVAVSPTPLSGAGGYCALFGGGKEWTEGTGIRRKR